jgi:TRAP-type C4-dicarboxylate transport system substrate-binding protein
MLTRRHIIASALAAPTVLRFGIGTAHAATTLKISHQFPGGTIDKGDFRDRLCRMFAAEVTKRSGGEIAAEIYPNSSLIKTNAQFSAMRKGALDISLYPMPYAGGELPETNIGLMPGLVATYDQGLRWKKEPVGKALTDFLADKGIILLTWVWQAGGVASRSKPIVAPRRRQGDEGARRLARNGHGAADRGRCRAVGAVERNLRRDADRRLRRRHHLLHQPDLVPPRRGRQSR